MKKYIAEFVGTLVLVLFGCAVAVITDANVIATALAFGLAIVAMAYSIGNVSGCHINPAVSLGFLLIKKISIKNFIGYVIAQILGALAGASILGILLGSFDSLGANGYGNTGQLAENIYIAFLIEIVLTFVFVTVILSVTTNDKYSNISGIIIGFTLILVHLMGISFTGTSVNPARSLGPALLQGGNALLQAWVFILAPLIGGALASLFFKFILNED